MPSPEPDAGGPQPNRRSRPPARRPLVSGNWKMHHDHMAALHLVRDLGLRLPAAELERVEVVVHPPFSDLRSVQVLVEGDDVPIALGAQHSSDQDEGALTGEVSPAMLARLGVRYVLVGHSERRRLFGMTDDVVASTLRAVLRHSMTPICCVGETEEERDRGHTERRLGEQVRAALSGLDPATLGSLVIAYEPLWAIGTGRAASAVDAEDACVFIRALVAELGGPEAEAGLRIQYGGSVTPENAADLVAEPDIDGLLVGGASLEAGPFRDIVGGVDGCYRSLAR
jgi:triosephosphate isomerase (TIM)